MDKKDAYGSKYSYDPDFNGPLKKRSCTDVGFLLIFLGFICTWIVIAAFSFPMGNPEKLIHPTDSTGRICGGNDPLVKNKPFLFFFDILKCARPTALLSGCETPQVCVEKCPEKELKKSTILTWNEKTELKLMKNSLICTYDVNVNNISSIEEGKKLIGAQKCASDYKPSEEVSGRCIPTEIIQYSLKLMENAKKYSNTAYQMYNLTNTESDPNKSKIMSMIHKIMDIQISGQNIIQDIGKSRNILMAAFLESAILSFIYLYILGWMVGPLVWITLFGICALLTFGIVESWSEYENTTPNSEMSIPLKFADIYNGNIKGFLLIQETWLTLIIVQIILLTIILLITIGLRNRLRIATGLIQEASKAIDKMKTTLFFPLIIHVLQILVILYGITLALYIATSGHAEYKVQFLNPDNKTIDCVCNVKTGDPCDIEKFTPNCGNEPQDCNKPICSYFSYVKETYIQILQVFNFIIVIWVYSFISASGQMILASTFASWYWTFNKLEFLKKWPLFGAIHRTVRYHLGTVAFGSLLLTICRLIKLILEYIELKLKKYSERSKIVRGIFCFCKCCFSCVERFLKFFSKNAYIMCAIHGTNFCKSAKDAFFLIMRNIIRAAVLNSIYQFILFLGKLLIIIATATQWYYILTGHVDSLNDYVPDLNSPALIVLIIIIITYFVTKTIFGVYIMAIDTIFLCFLEDLERNDGTLEKPYYMSATLKNILNKENDIN